eukprot:Gregarina_sp_Pseudo_9__2271@NODE_25_length_5633_cov_38_635860_g23_i0_p2_GENE_NODE_25_length_5633_cov_38_635860_g23_i0NODE_25_length_5633_cov_38_635860_g23_i0_p2_ORF_typecomplete_len351_score122_44_NODE_25_length_5633_cov_38_635860_g23_i06481700
MGHDVSKPRALEGAEWRFDLICSLKRLQVRRGLRVCKRRELAAMSEDELVRYLIGLMRSSLKMVCSGNLERYNLRSLDSGEQPASPRRLSAGSSNGRRLVSDATHFQSASLSLGTSVARRRVRSLNHAVLEQEFQRDVSSLLQRADAGDGDKARASPSGASPSGVSPNGVSPNGVSRSHAGAPWCCVPASPGTLRSVLAKFPSLCECVVRTQPLALECLPPECRLPRVCLVAVSLEAEAFRFVPSDCREYLRIGATAIQGSRDAIRHISLRSDCWPELLNIARQRWGGAAVDRYLPLPAEVAQAYGGVAAQLRNLPTLNLREWPCSLDTIPGQEDQVFRWLRQPHLSRAS